VLLFVSGGGHGGRPHPFSVRLRLCFTGGPRMGPSMPLPALRLSIGRIGLQDSSPAAGSFVIRPSKNEIDAHLGVISFFGGGHTTRTLRAVGITAFQNASVLSFHYRPTIFTSSMVASSPLSHSIDILIKLFNGIIVHGFENINICIQRDMNVLMFKPGLQDNRWNT